MLIVITDMKEIWKPSPEYGDRYEVSNLGNARRANTHSIIKPYLDRRGYYRVYMSDGLSEGRSWLLHRMIAIAFEKGDGPVVRHLDGNSKNNHVDNLMQGTQKENGQDSIRHGAVKKLEFCARGHRRSGLNIKLMKDGNTECIPCKSMRQVKQKIVRDIERFERNAS